jgi:hypothetical protein
LGKVFDQKCKEFQEQLAEVFKDKRKKLQKHRDVGCIEEITNRNPIKKSPLP